MPLNKNTFIVSICKIITLLPTPDQDDEQQYIIHLQ